MSSPPLPASYCSNSSHAKSGRVCHEGSALTLARSLPREAVHYEAADALSADVVKLSGMNCGRRDVKEKLVAYRGKLVKVGFYTFLSRLGGAHILDGDVQRVTAPA